MLELEIIITLILRKIITYVYPQISDDFLALVSRKCIHLNDISSVQVDKQHTQAHV